MVFRSASSVGAWMSAFPSALVVTEGSFSGLSSPFVPQVMSWVLQKAYTFRMLMYVGVISKYWMKQVNICHGSKNKNETMNHMTYVEANETIKLKKIVFWKTSAKLKPSLTVSCIDLTVM